MSALPVIEHIDWTQRTFTRPFILRSESLRRLGCSHVKHIGGLISTKKLAVSSKPLLGHVCFCVPLTVCFRVQDAEFHGSDMLTLVECTEQAPTQQEYALLAFFFFSFFALTVCRFDLALALAESDAMSVSADFKADLTKRDARFIPGYYLMPRLLSKF